MTKSRWKQLTLIELNTAESARQSGNEGRARVCARRAAGHVAAEYLSRQDINLQTENALKKLRYLLSFPEVNPAERETIEHFLIHTTPDHQLPIDADLITDVHLLARQLLGETIR